jgi:hypothetical protein
MIPLWGVIAARALCSLNGWMTMWAMTIRVRAIDAFVDELDLAKLGFGGVEPQATGRPATLLKIYVYGYLNRVQSSRRLERECPAQHRARLADRPPDAGFQNVADFRKDNSAASARSAVSFWCCAGALSCSARRAL